MPSIEQHGGSFVSSFRLNELVQHPPVQPDNETAKGIFTLDDLRSVVPIRENTNAAPSNESSSSNYEEYIPTHSFYKEPHIDMELQEIIDMSG